jgi:hypothetical protein
MGLVTRLTDFLTRRSRGVASPEEFDRLKQAARLQGFGGGVQLSDSMAAQARDTACAIEADRAIRDHIERSVRTFDSARPERRTADRP